MPLYTFVGTNALASQNVRYGSVADEMQVIASRPLYPGQRTNAEASLNVCVGPLAVVGVVGRYSWSRDALLNARAPCVSAALVA
jgi:hypothetical protein